MNNERVRFTVDSAIHDGKLGEFERVVTGFEVYGNPGPQAAEILAGFGADLCKHWHGLGR